MKKAIIGFILEAFLMLSVPSFAETFFRFTQSQFSLYVDGIKIDNPMYIKDWINHVPLRAVSEALGADVKVTGTRVDITKPLTDLETVVKNTKDSAVMIYVYKDGKRVGQGSGFVYNGYVVTAKHVTDTGNRYDIFTDDSLYGVTVASTVKIDTKPDVAVIDAKLKLPSVKLGDSAKLVEGEKLVSITSPAGALNMVDECLYSGVQITATENQLGISDTFMGSGSSGGPIFNYNSELVAMAFSGIKGSSGAIPINHIKHILQKLK